MRNNYIFAFMLILLMHLSCNASVTNPEFSTAGFFQIENAGRSVYSMNPAWRMHKGKVNNGQNINLDDRQWQVVSLPNGIEYVPTEASGCINYQGEVWYRKHFIPSNSLKGKKLFLHFEAIMGKSKVYVNGKLIKEHFGGYLPVVLEVTDALKYNQDNLIAVWADNSNDPNYPPGKPQETLDFTYFGGIYRDCWLIAHNNVYITDPNVENEVASGGFFVSYDKVSDKLSEVLLTSHIRNTSKSSFNGVLEYELIQPDGKRVALIKSPIAVSVGKAITAKKKLAVKKPMLWSPESPNLYNIIVKIRDKKGTVIDGYRQKIGIRSVEFKGKDGFWLNGKPYENPLIGANRHQDFAVLGNAVPNSLHWRDAKKLRDVGLKVIRNAHCPQDPAFMDACDELGLFVIVNTPGWQFWNDAPIFAERVFDDIRNLVRRDRNHASVWLWEPILNETWYPADFAKKTLDIVAQEYPYSYCYSGCDSEARGHEVYPVLFTHPTIASIEEQSKKMNPNVTYFTREWGDNVDDWNSHNSPSRVARNWGEVPMLVQAEHYANPSYDYTSYNQLFLTPRQHMGGCLWHSFDHQRGYHPDPFYGGIMDVYRQPKYSYYMFMSQRSAEKEDKPFQTGPMVYIANEMTPFSPKDVTVYSNCDEVRLTYNKDGKVYTYTREVGKKGMPSPVIVFKDVFDFMIDKEMSRKKKQDDVYLLAEGLIDGKVVASHKVAPARRPSKLLLWADNENMDLKADGSDVVTLVAAVADANGNIKHLNNYYIKFTIQGEGRILGSESLKTNPVPVKWGTAPVLIQSTTKPGKIKVVASVLFEGSQMPTSAVLELNSVKGDYDMIFSPKEEALMQYSLSDVSSTASKSDSKIKMEMEQQKENMERLKEVEKQQTEFGEKK